MKRKAIRLKIVSQRDGAQTKKAAAGANLQLLF